MLHQNIETFIGCESSYADADIVLYGAPFDSTTSYRPAHGSAPPPCVTKLRLETYSPYHGSKI